MIAAYIRVSSLGQSLDSQVDAIRKAAATRGDTVDRWFQDIVKGSSSHRAGLTEFLGGARRGDFETVYIFRVDRVSRAGILHAFSVISEIRETGCKIISVGDPFQIDGPFGDLVLAILSYIAEMERENIRIRQLAARKALETQGKSWGRPPSTSILQRQLIWQYHEQKFSVRKIAVKMKIPRATVQNVIEEMRRASENPLDEIPPTERSIRAGFSH